MFFQFPPSLSPSLLSLSLSLTHTHPHAHISLFSTTLPLSVSQL
uniref:Uncharacterized protein n=1 Tax=Anguilla anguilla TaxID=7936 RepID=A0A0E9VS90_ANGAN